MILRGMQVIYRTAAIEKWVLAIPRMIEAELSSSNFVECLIFYLTEYLG